MICVAAILPAVIQTATDDLVSSKVCETPAISLIFTS